MSIYIYTYKYIYLMHYIYTVYIRTVYTYTCLLESSMQLHMKSIEVIDFLEKDGKSSSCKLMEGRFFSLSFLHHLSLHWQFSRLPAVVPEHQGWRPFFEGHGEIEKHGGIGFSKPSENAQRVCLSPVAEPPPPPWDPSRLQACPSSQSARRLSGRASSSSVASHPRPESVEKISCDVVKRSFSCFRWHHGLGHTSLNLEGFSCQSG